MTGIVDSKAHFESRCAEVLLPSPVVATLQTAGLTTLAQLAYAIGQPGQPLPDGDFQTWATVTIGTMTLGAQSALRRLIFEAQTLLLQDLRQQISDPASGSVRPIAEAERASRLQRLKKDLGGLHFDVDSTPSNALLDLTCAMAQVGEAKYIAPAKCTSRALEACQDKTPQKIVHLESEKLVIKEGEASLTPDTSTPLLLQNAFKRRGLATHFAGICSYVVHDRYVAALMSHLTREQPQALPRCTAAQVVEADRLVWLKLLEAGQSVKPKSAEWPIVDQLQAALESYQVAFSLIPRPGGSGGGGQDKKKKKSKKRKRDEDKHEEKIKDKPKGKGKGKDGKDGKGRGVTPKEITDLGGKSQAPDGRAICFGYNLRRCVYPNCTRLHQCALCMGGHAILDHPKSE
jgi:hypothetical protein